MTARSMIRGFYLASALWAGLGIGCLVNGAYLSALPSFAAALGFLDGAVVRAKLLLLAEGQQR